MQHALFIALLVVAANCAAAEHRVLPRTISPDKQVAIVEYRANDGERDYYFVHQPSGKRLGFVLPAEQRHAISNVAILASWNTSSAKVALLVFYGTKLNELLIYSRSRDGTFQQVGLNEPDPLALYRQRTGKKVPQSGDGYSENGIGPWLDQNTVALLAGEARQTQQLDEYLTVFATYRAHVNDTRATISKVKLIGPLTNKQSDRFVRHWGEQYVIARDDA